MLEDWDRDGSPDFAEYRAGTHPGLASDLLELNPTRIDAITHELRWPSRTGRAYRIVHRTSPEAPWKILRRTSFFQNPSIVTSFRLHNTWRQAMEP